MRDLNRVLLLTPQIAGADGISEVGRQLVAGLGSPDNPARSVDVASLTEEDGTWGDGVRVAGAGASRIRFTAALLRRAARGDTGTVLINHVHLLPAALPLLLRGARGTLILHGVEAWRRLTWLETAAARQLALAIAVSRFTAERFLAANPELAGLPLAICPPAVRRLSDDDQAIGRSRQPAALIVGRMSVHERYKGHDALLDIWPAVAAQVPGAQLWIAGDGDDRQRLESRVASAGLTECVTFFGKVDDRTLVRLYRECAVFAMPSDGEGFGLVFLEAMRAGTPCIGAHGAAAEIIQHGVTGMLVEPGRSDALLEAIVFLLRDSEARLRMGHAAAALVRTHFAPERFASRLQLLLAGTEC